MDLKTLKYFVATVETGSISAASKKCFVAQPSITMAIAKLEDELGCMLFNRHRKGSTPTSDGHRMYQMASELLQHAESIKQEFIPKHKTQKINILVDDNIRISILESFLNEANEHNPDCQFEITRGKQAVNKSTVDLRLTTRSQISVDECFSVLAIERYALLMPTTNLLAYQKEIKPSDLNHQNIISRIYCENMSLFESMISGYGLDVNIVSKVESDEWAHALVGSGLGITFAPVPADFTDPRFVVRPVSDLFDIELPEREVGLAFNKAKLETFQTLFPQLFT